VIVLFTDFGADDIYVAQMKAALLEDLRADTSVVDLLHSVPNFQVKPAAHLLAALQSRSPPVPFFWRLSIRTSARPAARWSCKPTIDGSWDRTTTCYP